MQLNLLKQNIMGLTVGLAIVTLGACAPTGTPTDTLAAITDSPPVAPTAKNTDTPPPTMSAKTTPIDDTSTVIPTALETEIPTPTHTPSSTDTPLPTETPVLMTPGLLIDHNTVAKFNQIPDEYIQAAREIRWLHRGASVGVNIAATISQNGRKASSGLNCLSWTNLNSPQEGGRPNSCGCPQATLPNRWENICQNETVFLPVNEKYTRDNWQFEVHPYRVITDNLQEINSINPGWQNKTNYFIRRVDTLAADERFDYVSYQMGYVEGASINEQFFSNTADVFLDNGQINYDDAQPGVANLEALESAHPEFKIIRVTSAQARLIEFDSAGVPHVQAFNQSLRNYTAKHGGILFDLADIQSYLPDGTPCFGIDAKGASVNVPTVCDEYVDEKVSGHLNALGANQVAQAIWVMMAQLAGWNGE